MSNKPGAHPALGQAQEFAFCTPSLNRLGEVVSWANGGARQVVEDLGGGVNLELVEIPAGSFQMGSHQHGGYEDERPLHPVFLSSFWMGRYPVTQAQWQAVFNSLPACRFHGANLPVESISWKEAARFCQQLARSSGRGYALPSEAQWEYACRAGTTSPFSCGETLTTDFANYVGEHRYADEPAGIYRHGTTPVGSFPPNPWGLADMHGNVWEFCADVWHANYEGAPLDSSPRSMGAPGAKQRVARGGSWHETPGHCRSAVRLEVSENDRMEYYGFRVMLFPGR